MTKWISVKNKLPDANKAKVILFHLGDYLPIIAIGWYEPVSKKWESDSNSFYWKDSIITHWLENLNLPDNYME